MGCSGGVDHCEIVYIEDRYVILTITFSLAIIFKFDCLGGVAHCEIVFIDDHIFFIDDHFFTDDHLQIWLLICYNVFIAIEV